MPLFPANKTFAFTIFDDTDGSTVENVGPVYQLLGELGFRTTKSVWPLPLVAWFTDGGSTGGTLADSEYLRFIKALQTSGFEIALHNVRNHHAERETVQRGLDAFREIIGHYPKLHANHYHNRDNLYWGTHRLSSLPGRTVASLRQAIGSPVPYEGHLQDSPYFWGDLCREYIQYVRSFTFNEINLLRVNPTLPYHDSTKPFVNFWFTSTDGGNVVRFCEQISERNQDRLEAEGGVCIVYTHFADGFCDRGILNQRFVELLKRLSQKNGWFMPVSHLLDFLRERRMHSQISMAELTALESRWLGYKLLHPHSR